MCLKIIANRYLKENDINLIKEEFDFNKYIKSLATIDGKINTFAKNYEPKTKIEIEDKKTAGKIFNKNRDALFRYYLDPNIIAELHKTYQHSRVDSVLNKHSKDRSSID